MISSSCAKILISKVRGYILVLMCKFGALIVIMANVVVSTALGLPWYLVTFCVEVVLSLKLLLYVDGVGGRVMDTDRRACDVILCSRAREAIVSTA
jgi:hypothetical protein